MNSLSILDYLVQSMRELVETVHLLLSDSAAQPVAIPVVPNSSNNLV